MGRYYNGDIEGKFWFAVQSSNSADRFGVQGVQPSYLEYCFDAEHLDGVNAEILAIETKLGDKKRILDEFFADKCSYSDDQIANLGISKEELSEYADLGLGIQIRDCIIENGGCSFEAEC